jgi:hypothetical protein
VHIDPHTLTGKQARKLVVPQKVVTLVFPGVAVKPPYDAALDCRGRAAPTIAISAASTA